MAARHKHHGKAKGGGVFYEGGGSNVAKESKETGADTVKEGGRVHGKHGKHRLDKRARGGRIGAEKHPFSSAAQGSDKNRTSHTSPTVGPR
jgi:hypothetical protein